MFVGNYLKVEQSNNANRAADTAVAAIKAARDAGRPTLEIKQAEGEQRARAALSNVDDRTIKSGADQKSVEGLNETVEDLRTFLPQLSDLERKKLPTITVPEKHALTVAANDSSASSASELSGESRD